MGKTATMKLIELMILKDDIDLVLEFLGKRGNFQFQDLPKENIHNTQNPSGVHTPPRPYRYGRSEDCKARPPRR